MSRWKRLCVVLTAVWVFVTLTMGAIGGVFVFGLFVAVLPPLLIWGIAWALTGRPS